MTLRSLIFLAPLTLAACVTVEGERGGSTDDAERGGLGKADLVGTCVLPNGKELCGGHGKGNCWCDEACVDYGDCCSDAAEVCGLDEPEPEGDFCGGLAGLTCDDGEVCIYAEGDWCGAADQLGECLTPPEACILLFDPVCGCDGETYSNSCFANAAGVSVASKGECEAQPQFCGGFAGLPCPDGQTCIDDPSDSCDPDNGGADCGGICVEDQGCAPVLCELFCENGFAVDETGCEVCSCAPPPPPPSECSTGGCSGELCIGPDDPGFSICIFLPEYQCLALSSCGTFGEDGGCGWDQTPEYLECMAQFQ